MSLSKKIVAKYLQSNSPDSRIIQIKNSCDRFEESAAALRMLIIDFPEIDAKWLRSLLIDKLPEE